MQNLLRWVNLTSFLAVWGAILSSVTFGWTLYRDLRDRAKIKVSAGLYKIGQRQEDGRPFMARPDVEIDGFDDKVFVVVSVVNIGRRPLKWKGLGGEYKKRVNGKNAFVVNTRDLPRMLEEQEEHIEYFDVDRQLAEGNVRHLMLWDVGDGKWKIPKKDMEKLADGVKKYLAKNP